MKKLFFLITLTVVLVMTAGLSAFAVSDGIAHGNNIPLPLIKANLIVKNETKKAKIQGDGRRLAALQSELSRQQSEIDKLAGRKVSEEEIVALAKEMGYYGPPDAWAQSDVNKALSSGLMVGRELGKNPRENAWKQPLKREEAAILANRVAETAQANLDNHDGNAAAHPAIQNRISAVEDWRNTVMNILKWIGALVLLIGLIAWLVRRFWTPAVVPPLVGGTPIPWGMPGAPAGTPVIGGNYRQDTTTW